MGDTAIIKEIPGCQIPGCKEDAIYDGKTKFGSWVYMCESHFMLYGIGLGTGLGQRLIVEK